MNQSKQQVHCYGWTASSELSLGHNFPSKLCCSRPGIDAVCAKSSPGQVCVRNHLSSWGARNLSRQSHCGRGRRPWATQLCQASASEDSSLTSCSPPNPRCTKGAKTLTLGEGGIPLQRTESNQPGHQWIRGGPRLLLCCCFRASRWSERPWPENRQWLLRPAVTNSDHIAIKMGETMASKRHGRKSQFSKTQIFFFYLPE